MEFSPIALTMSLRGSSPVKPIHSLYIALHHCRDTPDVHYVLRSISVKLATAIVLVSLSSQSHALEDQWYLGIGGGGSLLFPNPEVNAIDRNSDQATVGTLLIGKDFDSRSSGQLQLYSLGDIDFNNGQTASYSAAEAALLYRFYDSRDNQRGNPVFGASVYGRFGLGFIDRDTPVALTNETPVYFGAGAGVETYFTRNLGIRLEAQYLDTDTSVGTIALVGRFGGLRRDLARRPPPTLPRAQFPVSAPTQPSQPTETAPTPETFRRPGTTALPETAQVPATAQLPETTSLPLTPQLPETAQLPLTAQLPETEQLPETAALPEVAILPQVTLLPESDQPSVASGAQKPPLPTGIPENAGLPDVEIMVDATEVNESVQSSGIPVELTNLQTPSGQSNALPSIPMAVIADVDGDGIVDELDSCAISPQGFPVGNDGCSLFGGEIEGLRFESDSVTLVDGSTDGLDYLARLLVQFPDARIELVSHTDATGSETEQSRRTRGRLRSVGLYLVDQGVRSRQLVLRSFAAERPRVSNDTEQGRRANNRVEVIEKPR